MAFTILTKIFGSRNDRLLKTYRKTIERISALEIQYEGLNDEQLRAKTEEFKGRVANGETLDATDLIVAPGIIDLGVFATDKPAFRFGGITRAALMPDQSPAHDDPATIRFAGRKGKPEFWVHPLAAATKGLDGQHMAEIALMKDAGARGVATGRRWISDSGIMLRLMRYCAMLDLPLFVHSEDAGLCGNAVATTGANATLLGLASASPAAEMLSIQRDLVLAEESGAHIHFRQITTAR